MSKYENSEYEKMNERTSDCELSNHGNLCSDKMKHGRADRDEQKTEQDIEALVALLDGYTEAGDSRIRVDVVEGEGTVIARKYHHGRCDVGSPWANGTAFDVLEG